MKEAIKELFVRDLKRLETEMMSYQHEPTIWKTAEGITNSGGNLCLHIIGNLNTFIGNGLAGQSYVRDRAYEFSAKDVDRKILCGQINEVIKVVSTGLDNLTAEKMQTHFPIVIWAEKTPMQFTLLHLYGHLQYHLGQINYHRRMLDRPA